VRQAGWSGATIKNQIMMEVLEAASVGGLFRCSKFTPHEARRSAEVGRKVELPYGPGL
jgi:hypothetical protein